MKSYTDLEQSKKLAEFLSFESADMMYHSIENEYGSGAFVAISKVMTNGLKNDDFYIDDTPCWSLAALLEVIPQEIFDGEYIINITEGCDNKWVLTYDSYEIRDHSYYGLSAGADNLVDACTDIIIKLKERNII